MMFFQVLLVAGYAYAHLIHRLLSPKAQWLVQSSLLLVACLFLPIGPSEYWKPSGVNDPAWDIVLLLFVSIGLPFFVLTTTSPLLQAWVAKTELTRTPYRLYALSNVGSLLALLSYPFLFEPNLSLSNQSSLWAVTFIAFAIATFWSGHRFYRAESARLAQRESDRELSTLSTDAVSSSHHDQRNHSQVQPFQVLLWVLLPMAASIMLIACTNMMTHEIAAVPFLWILPLSLYLLTFVICFDHPRWYIRPLVWIPMWMVVVFGGFLMESGVDADLSAQILGYSAISFFTAFACHGELARLKPPVNQLTLFYLMIGVGGALGGIFVATIAPRIFDDFMEFYLGLFLTVILIFLAYLHQMTRLAKQRLTRVGDEVSASPRKWQIVTFLGYSVGSSLVAAIIVGAANYYRDGGSSVDDGVQIVFKTRSPYGVLTVKDVDRDEGSDPYRYLINGRIDHGHQFIGSLMEDEPVSYYGRSTGLGLAIQFLRNQADNYERGLHFGVIGLGVGITSAYAWPGDTMRYYEIDPQVESVAWEYFTYLQHCKERVGDEHLSIVLGDARVQLERDAIRSSIQFDLLAVDAFSSDAIPAHLLTLECFKLYKDCLTENGILAVHISNRYLDLEPVVMNIARELNWEATIVDVSKPTSCTWVIISNNPRVHFDESIVSSSKDYESALTNLIWTDNFASIFPLVDWKSLDLGDEFWQPIAKWFRKTEVE